jgi:hypothetical protein
VFGFDFDICSEIVISGNPAPCLLCKSTIYSIYILYILLGGRIGMLMSICAFCIGQILEYINGVYNRSPNLLDATDATSLYTIYTHILKKPNEHLVIWNITGSQHEP